MPPQSARAPVPRPVDRAEHAVPPGRLDRDAGQDARIVRTFLSPAAWRVLCWTGRLTGTATEHEDLRPPYAWMSQQMTRRLGKLEALDDPRLLLLHDRKMRKEDGRLSKANIDHLVVAPSGVWVVDAKQYQGSLEVRRAGGLFAPRVEQLWIAGRNKTALVDGVVGQVEAVRRELGAVGAHGVPVRAAMCFIGTELPWFGSSSISGIGLVGRRGLAKLVRQDGPLDDEERESAHRWLAARLPSA